MGIVEGDLTADTAPMPRTDDNLILLPLLPLAMGLGIVAAYVANLLG